MWGMRRNHWLMRANYEKPSQAALRENLSKNLIELPKQQRKLHLEMLTTKLLRKEFMSISMTGEPLLPRISLPQAVVGQVLVDRFSKSWSITIVTLSHGMERIEVRSRSARPLGTRPQELGLRHCNTCFFTIHVKDERRGWLWLLAHIWTSKDGGFSTFFIFENRRDLWNTYSSYFKPYIKESFLAPCLSC